MLNRKFWQVIRHHTLGIRDVSESHSAAVAVLVIVAVALLGMGAVDVALGHDFALLARLSDTTGSYLIQGIFPAVFLLMAFVITKVPSHHMHWLAASLSYFGAATTTVIATMVQDFGVTGMLFFCPGLLFGAYSLNRSAAITNWGVAFTCNAVTTAMYASSTETWTNFATMHTLVFGLIVMIMLARDAQQELQRKLQRLVSHDTLTGLLNRQELDRVLPKDPALVSPPGVALLLIDIDNFKTINDTHGHPCGDMVLRQVSAAVAAAGFANTTAYRLGGDELVCFLNDTTLEQSELVADVLVQRIAEEEFRNISDEVVPVTVSVGLAHWPTHAHMGPSLFHTADTALYEAKQRGKNQYATVPEVSQKPVIPTPSDHN